MAAVRRRSARLRGDEAADEAAVSYRAGEEDEADVNANEGAAGAAAPATYEAADVTNVELARAPEGIMKTIMNWFLIPFSVIGWIYDQDLYRFVFPVVCLLYAYFYDNLEHAYISHVYNKDKYGVVIVYFVLSLLWLVDEVGTILRLYILNGGFMQRLLASVQSRVFASRRKRAQEPQDPRERLNDGLLTFVLSLTFLVFMKILLFTLVFKNHTDLPSEEKPMQELIELSPHRIIHITMVISLGLVALSSHALDNIVRVEGRLRNDRRWDWFPASWSFFARKLILSIAYGTAFGYFASHAEALNYQNRTLNLVSVFLEAMVVVQTIG